MRIIVDLQGAQGASRFRGIGRYSLAFTKAFVRLAASAGHDVHVALNGMFPDRVDELRDDLSPMIPQSRIHTWMALGPVHMMDRASDARRALAEFMREAFLASLAPDLVVVTSLFEGMTDDVVTSIGKHFQIPTAVVLYDLIPLIYRDIYLPSDVHRLWYDDKIESLRRADKALAISNSAQDELIGELDFPEDQVTNISAAADPRFKPSVNDADVSALLSRMGISKPYLFYISATDERKNHVGLINAFAALPCHIRKVHQLVLGGNMPQEHYKALKHCAARAGLSKDEILFTHAINDDQLVTLYNGCKLFVFPSWHEGFGLPALEAMQCGRPVIASNCSSVPEVIGRADALFDPHSIASISGVMQRALTDDAWRADLQRWALEQAQRFSWDHTASRALAAINTWYANETPSEQALARVSPPRERVLQQGRLLLPAITRRFGSLLDAEDRTREQATKEAMRGVRGRRRFRLWINYRIQYLLSASRRGALRWLGFAPCAKAEVEGVATRFLSQNFPDQEKPRQLLVDISELVRRDAGSGIQRVVRSILNAWLADVPPGWQVRPVYATLHQSGYRYADQFLAGWQGTARVESDAKVEAWEGDVFLALDLQPTVLAAQASYLQELRRRGVIVLAVVYDLLPLQFPHCFGADGEANHARWLQAVCRTDGAICISRAVAQDLIQWMKANVAGRARPFGIEWFHLGADIENSMPSTGILGGADAVLHEMERRPTFLMVGTLEPRKGHAQVIKAFQNLWADGVDANLIIVGKQGWMVDGVVASIRATSKREARMIWFDGPSDELLEAIYRRSTALIAASLGEGFGLPLVEAANRGLPVIARDIAVFREAIGEGAYFFPDDSDDGALAEAIREWLRLHEEDAHPKPDGIEILSWKQSADALFAAVSRLVSMAYYEIPQSSNQEVYQ